MTHFEYISVAIALIFAMVIARLIGGLPHVSDGSRGSWISLAWTLSFLLGSITAWWVFWRFRVVIWTPLRFVWVLGAPGLFFLQAAVLLTDNPSQVSSWEAHFFGVRKRLFGIFGVKAIHTALSPWIYGLYSWGTFSPAHPSALVLLAVCALGVMTASRRVHLALAISMVGLNALSLFLIPDAG